MIKTEVAFLESRFLSSQSEQFKKILKALIGWKKAGLPKIHFCFDHVNRLIMTMPSWAQVRYTLCNLPFGGSDQWH